MPLTSVLIDMPAIYFFIFLTPDPLSNIPSPMIDTCDKCGAKQEWHAFGQDEGRMKRHYGCGGTFETTDVGCIENAETAESRKAWDRLSAMGKPVTDTVSGLRYTEIHIPSRKKPTDPGFVPEWSVRKKKS